MKQHFSLSLLAVVATSALASAASTIHNPDFEPNPPKFTVKNINFPILHEGEYTCADRSPGPGRRHNIPVNWDCSKFVTCHGDEAVETKSCPKKSYFNQFVNMCVPFRGEFLTRGDCQDYPSNLLTFHYESHHACRNIANGAVRLVPVRQDYTVCEKGQEFALCHGHRNLGVFKCGEHHYMGESRCTEVEPEFCPVYDKDEMIALSKKGVEVPLWLIHKRFPEVRIWPY